MKNKRYKRLAKRLQGECHNTFLCVTCKYYDTCWNKFTFYENPYKMDIREIELRLKESN